MRQFSPFIHRLTGSIFLRFTCRSACALTARGTNMTVADQSAHELEHLIARLRHFVLQVAGVVLEPEVGVDDEVRGWRDGLRLRDDTVVDLLEVLLHLVRPGELLGAHRAGEHLPLLALVIQERVALEAVLVLETLLQLHLVALKAPVGPVAGDLGVLEQVQPAHRHVLQALRLRARLGRQVAPGPRGGGRLAGRRGGGGWG